MAESSIPPASTIPPNEINTLGKAATAQSVPIRAYPCGVGQREGKPRFVRVTDPEEIQAIARNELTDPIGGEYAGAWYAYDWSLKRYRERRAVTANGGQP